MTRKAPVNVAASVRARLLKVSKERREDFTLTLVNYASERFLYRLSKSKYRDQFILKGAMLFAARIGEPYRPTRDLDLLGMGEATEAAIDTAVRDIIATDVGDDGLVFDVDTLRVHVIREDDRYGGMRASLQGYLAGARIPVQIDIGFGDAVTPAATDLDFPTLLEGMPSANVLAYPMETVVAEKVEAMVRGDRGDDRQLRSRRDRASELESLRQSKPGSIRKLGTTRVGTAGVPAPATPTSSIRR